MSTTTYKIVLIGESGVGKTTFLKRHLTGEFETKHVKTMGVRVNIPTFDTTKGKFRLKIWDTAGDHKFVGLREGYYKGSDAAVVMFDVMSETSYLEVDKWVQLFRGVCPDCPIVLCGNKVDEPGRVMAAEDITKHTQLGLTAYYDISAKSNYNFEQPFLTIIREVSGNPTLNFV